MVIKQLKKESFKKLHIVLGVVNDKDLSSVLGNFPKEAAYYFCRPDIPRGLDAEVLMQKAKDFKLMGTFYDSVPEAYAAALTKADKDDLIYAGGSTFLVAELPI
jgi:dihydrofolate synthase/folylpolyglutamate synthase